MTARKQQRNFQKIYLEPSNQRFSDVTANSKKYVIPRFQRDFSWDAHQLEELWQDIEHLRENRTQHFMGYIVLQTEDDRKFEIIDGQQRLTTLSILVIAAICRTKELIDDGIAPKENIARVKEYRRLYIDTLDPVTLKSEPKMVLNRHNDLHFRSLARHLKVTNQRNLLLTNQKINSAFRFFKSKFDLYHSGEEIASILNDIAEGLLFTTIVVNDELNAFMVFETLNERGLHLSTPDLLKNYLLSLMAADDFTEEQFKDFEEQWEYILEQLGETEFTNFLRSYWGMRRKLVQKKELFRVLKNEINSAEKVQTFLSEVTTHAPVYAALQEPNDNFWKNDESQYTGVKAHLEALKVFKIKTPLSLLMGAHCKFSPQDFIDFVRHIVAITIRYNVICKKRTNEQEAHYNEVANRLMNAKPSRSITVKELTQMLKPIYPDDTEFANMFTSAEMPSRQSKVKIMFLLRNIERQAGGNEPPLSVTLEHVLPFSPNDSWQEYFGRTTYELARNRLGNMALLPVSQNKNIGQASFSDKRKILKASPYQINKNIAEYAEWNIDTLNEHQQWLANKAKTVWKITQLG